MRRAALAIIVVWLAAMSRLFIADVFDESGGIVAFSNPALRAIDVVKIVLKTPLPFWRPLPTLFAALIIHAFSPEVSWRLLRVVNIALVLGALFLLRKCIDGEERIKTVFTFAYLFSAGAIIVATWFANIFDASVMLAIAAGLVLLTRGSFWAAGVVFGCGFFCKETAALVLPLLLILVALDRLKVGDAFRAGLPVVLIGAAYFALRNLVVPFGSASDTHQFHIARLLPSAVGFVSTYWSESMWGYGPPMIGFVAFGVSIAAFPKWRARAAYIAFVAVAIVMYLEMFDVWQGHDLIHYLMFVGRLYFVPVTLTLWVIALGRRWHVLMILAIPLFAGAATTYYRYELFQRSYRDVYRFAQSAAEKPLRVHYPMKPLTDPRRNIAIGDFPDAKLRIDPATGKLLPLDGAGRLR
jgi:hypothetical protein